MAIDPGERYDTSVPLFLNIASNISKEWRNIGRRLRISDAHLNHIEMDHRGNQQEINYQMLQKWKRTQGRYAKWKVLVRALSESGRTDLAQHVKEEVSVDKNEKTSFQRSQRGHTLMRGGKQNKNTVNCKSGNYKSGNRLNFDTIYESAFFIFSQPITTFGYKICFSKS